MSLRELVAKQKWFHAIDFGDFQSSGRFKPGTPQNITLFGTFEFVKRLKPAPDSCLLDIGTYDGIIAFGAKRLGYSNVIGTNAVAGTGFELARQALGFTEADVKFLQPIQIKDLHKICKPGEVDVVVNSGVIYHLLYPMEAFVEPRKLLKSNGYMILETPFLGSTEDPILSFNGASMELNEPSTYFLPTRTALIGMAQLAGFLVVSERILTKPLRITLLLKASTRSEIINHPSTFPFVVQMLKRDICDHHFTYARLERTEAPESAVVLDDTDFPTTGTIDPNSFIIDFPCHPSIQKDALGITAWETASGNTLKL